MNLLSLLRVAARRIPGLVSRLNRRESRPPSFFGAMQAGESAASLAMGLSPSLCSADGVRSERLRRLQLLGSSPRIRLGRRISFCVPMVWRLRVFMLALWTRSRVASLATAPAFAPEYELSRVQPTRPIPAASRSSKPNWRGPSMRPPGPPMLQPVPTPPSQPPVQPPRLQPPVQPPRLRETTWRGAALREAAFRGAAPRRQPATRPPFAMPW